MPNAVSRSFGSQLVVFAYQTGLVAPRAAGQAPGH
jgi:hypothetical protein